MPVFDGGRVLDRMTREFFDRPVMDNALRGYWCEAMVAEALGPAARIVSHSWHPWDIQIGPDRASFPERVRIQVKNSARLQTWHENGSPPSRCVFHLPYRRLPASFTHGAPQVPCEPKGFLCDLFALCLHSEVVPDRADQREPAQWSVYLLPVVGPRQAVTDTELAFAEDALSKGARSSNVVRRPETLSQGIRGRPPVLPISLTALGLGHLQTAFTQP